MIDLFKEFKKNGLNIAPYKIIQTEEDATKTANLLGYPVVMKAISPKIIHKTEFGAVKLNLYDKSDVINAYRSIQRNLGKSQLEGYLIQKQIKGQVELIIGGKKDDQFGQLIVFGLGGIFVEVYKDISVRVCPINKKDAIEMIKEIKGHPILAGARGKKPVNEKALVELLLKVSKYLEKNDHLEMDLNPVIADENGYTIVDARVIR